MTRTGRGSAILTPALSAQLTYYYHVDVIETTQHLRKELEDLSRQLVDTVNVAPRPETRLEANAIPLRVGVKESVKARVRRLTAQTYDSKLTWPRAATVE